MFKSTRFFLVLFLMGALSSSKVMFAVEGAVAAADKKEEKKEQKQEENKQEDNKADKQDDKKEDKQEDNKDEQKDNKQDDKKDEKEDDKQPEEKGFFGKRFDDAKNSPKIVDYLARQCTRNHFTRIGTMVTVGALLYTNEPVKKVVRKVSDTVRSIVGISSDEDDDFEEDEMPVRSASVCV